MSVSVFIAIDCSFAVAIDSFGDASDVVLCEDDRRLIKDFRVALKS